jgi:hypothetical protein
MPYIPIFSSYKEILKNNNFSFSTVGDANRKTDVPSTYRAVGKSCPTTCKFHPDHYVDRDKNESSGTCYAWSGHVRMQWSRFDENTKRHPTVLISQINAAVIAMYYRQKIRQYLREGNTTGARLHTSGDFYFNGRLDMEYIKSIYYAAYLLKSIFPDTKEFAYTYTAIPREEFEKYRIILRSVGVYINYSRMDNDNLKGGETIVWKHEKINELKVNPGVQVVPCLAQTHDDMTCRRCGLCGYKNHDNLLIVFNPHGHNRNNLMRIMSSAELKDDGSGKLKLFFNT